MSERQTIREDRAPRTSHDCGPSVDFLLRVADFAMQRHDHEQVEMLLELVYDHFDRLAEPARRDATPDAGPASPGAKPAIVGIG